MPKRAAPENDTQRARLWHAYACAALTGYISRVGTQAVTSETAVKWSATAADQMLKEYEKRWEQGS